MPVNMNTYNVLYSNMHPADMTAKYYLIDDLDDIQYRYNVVNG